MLRLGISPAARLKARRIATGLVARTAAAAKRKSRPLIADLVVLIGAGVADHGIALVSPAAAWVFGGVALVWFGLELTRKPSTSQRAQ